MKFPKVLYVEIDNTGSGKEEDDFFNAQTGIDLFANAGEITKVARYELVETGTVTAEPIFVGSGKKS